MGTPMCADYYHRLKFEFLVLCVSLVDSKPLGSHAAGSHPSIGQVGGVLDPSAAVLRHSKSLHTSVSGTAPPAAASVDVNRSVMMM